MKTIATKTINRQVSIEHRNSRILVVLDEGGQPIVRYSREEVERDQQTGEILSRREIGQDSVRLAHLEKLDPKAAEIIAKLDKLVDARADDEEARKAAEAAAIEAERVAAEAARAAVDAARAAEVAAAEKALADAIAADAVKGKPNG